LRDNLATIQHSDGARVASCAPAWCSTAQDRRSRASSARGERERSRRSPLTRCLGGTCRSWRGASAPAGVGSAVARCPRAAARQRAHGGADAGLRAAGPRPRAQRDEATTAAELVAEIGDCRGRYPTRDTLAADAGQAAVAIESGKRKAACFRWACNKRLRQAFVTLADTSRHHNPWAQDLYAAAIGRGHDHPRAIRTLGRGWCRIVWRCWQDRAPYDPARHRALQRHVTVTIPTSSGPVPDTAATQRMAGATVTQRADRKVRAQRA